MNFTHLIKVICFTWVSLLFAVPVAGLDAPHDVGHNMNCYNCHDASLPDAPVITGININNFCTTNCHNAAIGPYSNTSAPKVLGHSSEYTGTKYGSWVKQCCDCHSPHYHWQKSWSRSDSAKLFLFTGQIDAYSYDSDNNTSTLTYSGGVFKSGWDIASLTEKTSAARRTILVPNRRKMGNDFAVIAIDATTMTVAGDVSSVYTYINPPTNFGIIYGQYIKHYIDRNDTPDDGSDDAPVKFFDKEGDNSFADGDATYDGICEVCHTMTDHFRNDGSGPDQNHTSAGVVVGGDCTRCHSHSQGFAHGTGSNGSGCEPCHGHDPGYGGGTGGEGTFWSHSTHTENDSDDLKGPNVGCDTCHDTDNFPDFADGHSSLALTEVCDPCHSEGGTYDGINDPVVGAKNNWGTGIYQFDNVSLQAGKEKWCATCHDEDPSVIGAISAPNVIGDEDGAYLYGSGWGYYKTGHGLESQNTYAASGGLTAGAGKGCDDCHDLSTSHIDTDARTYSAASNNYQAGYRLKSIDGYAPMTIPHPQNIDDHDPGHYGLCLSCHDANKYLLKTPNPVTTSFRDDLDIGPWDGGDAPINVHEYHLVLNSLDFDSDWNGSYDSEIVCITCHNVHGSTRLSMIRDGKLVDREPGMEIYYDNVMTPPTTYTATAPDPANIPLNTSTGTVFLGASLPNVCQHCHGANYTKYYRSAPGGQVAPSLDWTGEANYSIDGVDPNSGMGGDFFTFRIKYTDANFQPPRSIQVWVDANDNGAFETDEKHEMYEVESSDVDVSDGKLYRTILSINSGGDASLAYRFYALDGALDATNGAASGDPLDDTANSIIFANNPPVLAWTSESGYTADGVSPDSSESGSTFTFRISYTDADNNPPTASSLWLDRDDDGTSVGDEDTEIINLLEVDSDDTTYTDGKLYYKDVYVEAAGDGILNYSFFASDASDDAIGSPTTVRTLTVTIPNSAPQLAWSREVGYSSDGVYPNTDVAGATFTFRVQYLDEDNNPPSSIQIWVDKNDDNDYDDAEEKLDMQAVDDEPSYSDGKIYTKDVVLSLAGDGILNHRFFASDGSDTAIGIPIADNFLTIITGALKVSCEATGEYHYTSIQTAINNAPDGGTILVADGNCTETITIDNKDLTIKSVNGAASTIIDGAAGGTVVTMINGADTTIDGLTIQNGDGGSGYGGGFSITDSSPTISNCTVTANSSAKAAGIYVASSGSTLTISNSTVTANNSSYQGGALYLNNGASAVISDTLFHDNHTVIGSNGGAIYMQQNSVDDASLTISGSTFTQNTAAIYGGAIYIMNNSGTLTVDISSSIFTASDTTDAGTIAATRNSSGNKGGVLYMAGVEDAISTLTISDSTIEYGDATYNAGGMYLVAIDSTTISGSTFANNSANYAGFMQYENNTSGNSISITDSIIRDNSATIGSNGALYMLGGTILFERCSITGNSAQDKAGAGFIVSSTTYPTVTTIQNSIITGNRANQFWAGAFWFNGGTDSTHPVNIINSTFSGNYAGTHGGGFYINGTATATVTNSIFWRNGAGLSSYEISGTVSASYSDIRQTGYEGNNNLNLNPLFADPISYVSAPTSDGDYHLLPASPVVDAGTAVGAPSDDVDGGIRPLGSGVDMGADEVVTVANNAPLLTWTAEENYNSDGVSPDTGDADSSFEFRVEYSDANNDAPTLVQVWIDTNDDGDFLDIGEKRDMNAVDGDSDYTDGKLYTWSEALGYMGDGILQYRFYAADSMVEATGVPTLTNSVIVNTAPLLSWLGSGDYVDDGTHPDTISSGETVEFRVNFSDVNDNQPTSIQVWVDMNDDDDYMDNGEQLTMTEVDPGDSVYTDGKEYSISVDLSYAGDGNIAYRFYAADGLPATGDPTLAHSLTITNSAPVLTWIGTGNYIVDGVSPNGSLSGANYEFRVTYTDDDNQAPSSIQLYIDKNDDGDFLDIGEKIEMDPLDGDLVYSDGKDYTKTLILTHPGVGDSYLDYKFAAADGIDNAIGDPVVTSLPVGVFLANNAPNLEWTGEVGYTEDGTDPDSGVEGDNFTFRVKYTDIDNSAPIYIQVWVDLDNDSFEDVGEVTDLTQVDAGDTVYDDGKLYTVTIEISSVEESSTNYRFKAHDGTDVAIGSGTENNTILVSSPITVCPAGEPTCDYSTITDAIDVAEDGDYILVKDGTYSENISYGGKDITIISENGYANTTIQGTGANSPVVTFNGNETDDAILDGFTIDNLGGSNYTRGIYIYQATPTIKNSLITGNRADNVGDSATQCYGGGGVCIIDATPTFDNCTISANTAANRHGCGMYIKGAAGGANITNNSIIGGDATEDGNKCTNGPGGGIYFTGSTTGTLTIMDSNIQYNQGLGGGGGLYLATVSKATVIENSTILNNYTGSSGYGGGLYATSAPVEISNGTLIDSNIAGDNRAGGGIYSTGSSLSVSDSTIMRNVTGLNNNGEGGGIYFNGTTLNMTKGQVLGNKSTSHGGGIRIVGGTATIVNSIIAGNTISRNDWRYGGGIANNGTLNLYFSTVTDNYGHDGGGLDASGTEHIYNSIIWGNAVAVGRTNPEVRGATNTLYLTEINGDTSFENRSTATKTTSTYDGDYHLQVNSNCIDSGDATNKPGSDDDIEGNARPIDIAGKGDGINDYDKGAYEYVTP